MNLVEIRKTIKAKKVEMMKKIVEELEITSVQADLLQIILSKQTGNEPVDPLDLNPELAGIGIELWTDPWTKNIGELHKKNLIKLRISLNTDPENTTTDQAEH